VTVARVAVVANPTAGHGKAGTLIGKVDAALDRLRIEHEIRVTRSPEEMRETAGKLAAGGATIVAVLGGDGSVNAAVNGVLGSAAALSVLPAGTGDDFASAIGVGKLDVALRQLADPQIRAIDVVKVTAGTTVRHFVNVAGAGFDSEVNETANAMTVRLGGTGTYVAAVVKTLSRFVPARYEVAVDDDAFTVDAMLAVVGNGMTYGGGMKVLPSARVDDGLLDVCIVEQLSKPAFLRAFPRVYTGSHATHPKVRMLRGTRVTMEANRKIQLYADGERVGPLPAVFELLPGALDVVTGPDAKGIA
jgi:diacylglycerol kinase (ATP)